MFSDSHGRISGKRPICSKCAIFDTDALQTYPARALRAIGARAYG